MLPFPYSYGDEDSAIALSRTDKVILLSLSTSIILLLIYPKLAFANNETDILLAKCLSYLRESEIIQAKYLAGIRKVAFDEYKLAKCGINPVLGTFCIFSGICIEKVRYNLVSGNFTAAAGWGCGALSVVVAQKVCRQTSLIL